MTDMQDPADVEHVGHAHVYECAMCGDTVTNAAVEIARLRQEKAALLELLHRMIEHLEHCSDTWTPSDPLLADLRAMLDQAKPESP